jgi:hypothetical protein
MNLKSKVGKPILGYTDTRTVKLDLDETTFKKAKRIAHRVNEWYRLGGFVILKSSSHSFHVIFNRAVSWKKNLSIVAWASYIANFNLPLMRYLVMQCIKGSSTLRISPKGKKKSPKVVYRYGLQNMMVKTYFESRRELHGKI